MTVPSVPDSFAHEPAPPGPRRFAAELALVGAAAAFGTTFVVVQDAVGDVAPLPFLGVRFLIGGLALAPIAVRRQRRRGDDPRPLLRAGLVAGLVLAASYAFQTVGLQYTTTSASAFLTYLLVVFVPVLAALVLRRPPTATAVAAVVVASVGVYFLTGASVGLGRGELLTIACALGFAVHVIQLADYAPRFDLVQLNAVQIGVVGLVCLPIGAVAGGYRLTSAALAAAGYTGLVASAGAFGLQLYGQRHLDPTRAALILLLEPVFAAVIGYARGERLGAAGVVGAALILIAIVLSEMGGWLQSLTVRSRKGEIAGDA